jgi:hypothetical protein
MRELQFMKINKIEDFFWLDMEGHFLDIAALALPL